MQEGDALLKKVSKNLDTVIDPTRGPMLSGVEMLAVGQIKEEFANFRRSIIFQNLLKTILCEEDFPQAVTMGRNCRAVILQLPEDSRRDKQIIQHLETMQVAALRMCTFINELLITLANKP